MAGAPGAAGVAAAAVVDLAAAEVASAAAVVDLGVAAAAAE